MLKQFYEKALPSQGVYCVSGIDPNNNKITNRFAETLEDVFELVEKFKKKKVNVYVAPASFEGFSRKAESCVYVRSFFIDIDTHGKNSYDDKEGTLEALQQLLSATELPKPTCIDSGGGLHAYWVMDRDIPYEEWKPLAEKFKSLCLKHIAIDTSVTADGARLMRCPDTFNYRYTPPIMATVLDEEITVYDFDEFKKFMDEVETNQPAQDPFANVRRGLDEDTLAMKRVDNYQWDFYKIAQRSLSGDGCAQVKYWLENADTLGYDDWFSSMNIAYFCADGDKMIHEVSKDHPDYTEKQVEEKKLEFIKRGKPQTCEYLASQNPDRCKGCKHRGKIHTPIVLGKTIKEATEETSIVAEAPRVEPIPEAISALFEKTNEAEPVRQTQNTQKIPVFPDYLKPYIRGEVGGIYYTPPPKQDKKGQVHYEDPVEILAHILYPTRRLFSPLDGECMTMNLILPNDGLKEFLLPMKSVYGLEDLKKTLAFNQVIYTPKYINNIQEYLVKWSQYMINISKAQQMRMQFGWSIGRTSKEWESRTFVAGENEIISSTQSVEAPVSPYVKQLAKYFEPIGTFEKWQETAHELKRPGFELHALICLSGFGSPLLEFIDQGGFTLGLYGRSGNGKTGAMYAAVSTFGSPKPLCVFDSTDNGLVQRFVALHSMVFGLDEVTNKDPEVLSQLIHKISQGSAKIRMQSSANAEREHSLNCSLFGILTTNDSIEGKIERFRNSPDGERARYAELYIEQPDALKGPEGDELGRKIFDPFRFNYGHAGPMFIKELFKLSTPEVMARLAKWGKRYTDDTQGDASYRYYKNFISCTFAAAEIVVGAGILDYDIEHIYKKTIDTLNYMKQNISKINANDFTAVLNDFIYENMGNILRLKDGKVIDEPRGKLVARVATDEPTRISKEALKEYLNKRKMSTREFEKDLKERGVLLKVDRKHLETGWKATTNSQASYVYLIKNDFLDDKSEPDH